MKTTRLGSTSVISCLALLSAAILSWPAHTAMAGTVTFDFDTGAPPLYTGQPTPFDQTALAVKAHFSSPSDPGYQGFSVQTDGSTQYHMSHFSSHYLWPNAINAAVLDIRFSRDLTAITLTFATIDYQDNAEVPSDVKLTAYKDSLQNPPVGSAIAHATYGSDTYPVGTLTFDSGGKPFNLVRIGVVPGQPQGTPGFMADNIIVTPVPPIRVTSPLGFLNPGWNWFSLPVTPIDNTVAGIFSGYNVENVLYRWDPVLKTIQLYPNDFTTLSTNESYVLRLAADMQVSYDGYPTAPGSAAPVPEAGWLWVGFPKNGNVPLSGVTVHNKTTNETRTAAQDSGAGANAWINWNWLYWNSTLDTAQILGLSGADDYLLHPWQGYRLWSNVANLEVIYPEP